MALAAKPLYRQGGNVCATLIFMLFAHQETWANLSTHNKKVHTLFIATIKICCAQKLQVATHIRQNGGIMRTFTPTKIFTFVNSVANVQTHYAGLSVHKL